MNFSELVNLDELEELCQGFSDLTGVGMVIVDLEGNFLFPAIHMSDICGYFHRVHPLTAYRCRESDAVLADQLAQGERYNVYRCKNGMVDIAMPLIVGGEHLANLFTGQFFFEPPDRDYFIRQAEEFGFDQATYLDALSKVPIISENRARAIITHLSRMARLIGEMGLANEQLRREVEERKRIEEALRQSEERYRSLFEEAPISLWEDDLSACKAYIDNLRTEGVTDLRAYFEQRPAAAAQCLGLIKLLDVNQATLNLTKARTKEEVIANMPLFFTEASFKVFIEQLLNLMEGERQFESEGNYQTLTGEKRFIHLRFSVVPGYEHSLGKMLVSILDITERKQAEEKHEALIKELEAKNAELERFTYTVSHDLKSPLITIQGFLGFLQEDALAGNIERTKEDIARINDATEKMQQLLEELLELSRVGRLINPPEEIPFGELVHEAVNLVAGRLANRNVHVVIAPDLPLVSGDRIRLCEALLNLVDNALKYMGDQPHPQVEIGRRQEGEKSVFYVRDNGVGIDPRYHQQIFGLFDKLDQTSEGSGVGLAIVKRIVEVHGGHIWVESEGAGKGSTFCFTLPNTRQPASPQ